MSADSPEKIGAGLLLWRVSCVLAWLYGAQSPSREAIGHIETFTASMLGS